MKRWFYINYEVSSSSCTHDVDDNSPQFLQILGAYGRILHITYTCNFEILYTLLGCNTFIMYVFMFNPSQFDMFHGHPSFRQMKVCKLLGHRLAELNQKYIKRILYQAVMLFRFYETTRLLEYFTYDTSHHINNGYICVLLIAFATRS